jgi:chloramphenicol 3-O-phosphotransferase
MIIKGEVEGEGWVRDSVEGSREEELREGGRGGGGNRGSKRRVREGKHIAALSLLLGH